MVKMDDSEHVCPLCCEELDLSDREFYPCKCGYQVCMWCWHRIREQETGLCPACRTPYGEDPHQFTALDVEDVLKANKEAQAAAKRERQHQQHIHNNQILSSGDSDPSAEQNNIGAMEIPKDRTQLANMRVIRRNLVYAVGLPPSIASEEVLKKPDYFGQYGKIAKIVLNRSQVASEGGDPRRASASAYVTFQYKEDTLACILALDGFVFDGRNVRASYGTSKYCSAFIKNVRCNNPECTYLHDMGAAEDTFTKQEIQAGYVTSGRDVLERQQQILAEQLKQQQLSASGGMQLQPRKRVGGGGPSGTGKASNNPLFPAPEFDEPAKQTVPMVPAPGGMSRSSSTQVTMTQQQSALLNPATISAKLGRSASLGASARTAVVSAASVAGGSRKPLTTKAGPAISAAATTAASVVAGGRTKESTEAHPSQSTLSALTPLKRSTSKSNAPGKNAASEEKLQLVRNGKKQIGSKAATATSPAAAASKKQAPPKVPPPRQKIPIGGDLIGPSGQSIVHTAPVSRPGRVVEPSSGVASLGGHIIATPSLSSNRSNTAVVGGSLFTGQPFGGSSAVGSSVLGGAPLQSSISSKPEDSILRGGNPGLWRDNASPAQAIGGNGVIGSHISNKSGGSNSTSALASILGINLPTGSGSLHEASANDLWPQSAPPERRGPSPLSTLNGSAVLQSYHPSNFNMMPNQANPTNPSLIGGVPIGGQSNFTGSGAIGSGVGGASNSSDIALLQSLLPGVHITSDTSSMGYGGRGQGWTVSQGLGNSAGTSNDPMNAPVGWTGSGGNGMQSSAGSSVGAVGQNNSQDNRQGPGLW